MMHNRFRYRKAILPAAILSAAILLFLPGVNCTPPPFLVKKYAIYNFKDEGFLTPDILQTRGSAPRRPNEYGTVAGKRACLQEALEEAYRHTLTVLLHTHFDIKPQSGGMALSGPGFRSDYPVVFTPRDFILARIDFEPLLKKGFIALQDATSEKECTVVFRIMDPDLPDRIRKMNVTFQPESLPTGKRKERDRQRAGGK